MAFDVSEAIAQQDQATLQARARNRKEEIEEYERNKQRKVGNVLSSMIDMEAAILEGKDSTSCSCKVTGVTALGEYIFTCQETAPGECMFRIGAEPSTACIYCLERFEGDHVRKACIREEANDYARQKLFEELVSAPFEEELPGSSPVISTPF